MTKKIAAAPARMKNARTGLAPARCHPSRWSLVFSTNSRARTVAAAAERRISSKMKVATAASMKAENATRNVLSTVSTDAASTRRNDKIDRKTKSRSRRAEKSRTTISASTR